MLTLTTSIGVGMACEVAAQIPPAAKYLQEPGAESDNSEKIANTATLSETPTAILSVVVISLCSTARGGTCVISSSHDLFCSKAGPPTG